MPPLLRHLRLGDVCLPVHLRFKENFWMDSFMIHPGILQHEMNILVLIRFFFIFVKVSGPWIWAEKDIFQPSFGQGMFNGKLDLLGRIETNK